MSREVHESEIKALFASGDVLAKTVRTMVDDDRNWLYLLEQIQDPVNKRPVKPLGNNIDRSRRYNYLIKAWESIPRPNSRGAPKETRYTKKMSATLLPEDGCVQLYSHGDYISIGVLLNLKECNLKQGKYIFQQEVNTDERPWLKREELSEAQHDRVDTVSLEMLKQSLRVARENNKIPELNQILVGISHESVIGVFLRRNTLLERLVAYQKRAWIKKILDKKVPVLLLSSDEKYRFLSEEEIKKDIHLALNSGENNPNFQLAKFYLEQFPLMFSSFQMSKQRNDAFSIIMSFLTRDEQDQLSKTNDIKNRLLENIQYYAKESFERRVLTDARDLRELVAELIPDQSMQLNNLPNAELYDQYSVFLIDQLTRLLSIDNSEFDHLFNRIAYHVSQQNPRKILELIKESLTENKVVFPKIKYLIMQVARIVKDDPSIMLNLILFSDSTLLSVLCNSPFEFLVYKASTRIMVYADVARRSGEEMRYEKEERGSFFLSFLTTAVLFQTEEVIKSIIQHVPEELLKNTITELRSFKDFINKFHNEQYEWKTDFERRITFDQFKTGYKRLLKILYHLNIDRVALNKYEKRLLSEVLIDVIHAAPSREQLQSLKNEMAQHPLVVQQRHPFFDKLRRIGRKGEHETSLKTELMNACAERDNTFSR